MIYYIILFYLFKIVESQSENECELFWNTKQGLGYGNGLKLQLCCNISKVTIFSFKNVSTFSIGKKVFETNIDKPNEFSFLSQLQLSKCSDSSKPTLGYVASRPGLNCTHRTGQSIDIPKEKVKFPGWYLVCYEFNNGCQQRCSIEILCENDMSSICGEIFVMSSSPSSTNNSLKYWVKRTVIASQIYLEKGTTVDPGQISPPITGGSFPLTPYSAKILVTARNDRNEIAFEKTIQPEAGKTDNLSITGLLPNEMYRVERCLIISIPENLKQSFNFASNTSKLCAEEGFLTQRTSLFPNFANFVIVLSIIVLF